MNHANRLRTGPALLLLALAWLARAVMGALPGSPLLARGLVLAGDRSTGVRRQTPPAVRVLSLAVLALPLLLLATPGHGASCPANPGGAHPVVPTALVDDICDWRARPGTNKTARNERFTRVLAAFGVETHASPMTVTEAQGYVDRGWGTRWTRITKALQDIEDAPTIISIEAETVEYQPPPTLQSTQITVGFTTAKYFAYERSRSVNNNNLMHVRLELSEARSEFTTVVVQLTANTATADVWDSVEGTWAGTGDYFPGRSGGVVGRYSASFPAGKTLSNSLDITIYDDLLGELGTVGATLEASTGEEFNLEIVSAPAGVTIDATSNTAVGVIVDDEITVCPQELTYLARERDKDFELTVAWVVTDSILHTIDEEIVVELLGADAEDVELLTTRIRHGPGQSLTKEVKVKIVGDDEYEDNELFQIRFLDDSGQAGMPAWWPSGERRCATDVIILNDDRPPSLGVVYEVSSPAAAEGTVPEINEGDSIEVRAWVAAGAHIDQAFDVMLYAYDAGSAYVPPNSLFNFGLSKCIQGNPECDHTVEAAYGTLTIPTKRSNRAPARDRHIYMLPLGNETGMVWQRYVTSGNTMKVLVNEVQKSVPVVTVRPLHRTVVEGDHGDPHRYAEFVLEAHTIVEDAEACRAYGAVGAVQTPCLIEGIADDITVNFRQSGDYRLEERREFYSKINIKGRGLVQRYSALKYDTSGRQTDALLKPKIFPNDFKDRETEGAIVTVVAGNGYTPYSTGDPKLPGYSNQAAVRIIDDEGIEGLERLRVSLAPIADMTEGQEADVCLVTNRAVTQEEVDAYTSSSLTINILIPDEHKSLLKMKVVQRGVTSFSTIPEIIYLVAGETRHCLSDIHDNWPYVDRFPDGRPRISLHAVDRAEFNADAEVRLRARVASNWQTTFLKEVWGAQERTFKILDKNRPPSVRYSVDWKSGSDAPRITEKGGTHDFTFRLDRALVDGEFYEIYFTNTNHPGRTLCGLDCDRYTLSIPNPPTNVTHTYDAGGDKKHKLRFEGAGAQEITFRVTAKDNTSTGVGNAEFQLVHPFADINNSQIFDDRRSRSSDQRKVSDSPLVGEVFFTDDDSYLLTITPTALSGSEFTVPQADYEELSTGSPVEFTNIGGYGGISTGTTYYVRKSDDTNHQIQVHGSEADANGNTSPITPSGSGTIGNVRIQTHIRTTSTLSTIQWSQGSFFINENNGPSQPVIVADNAPVEEVRVRFRVQPTSSNSATLGEDYLVTAVPAGGSNDCSEADPTNSQQIVTLPAGVTATEANICLIDDAYIESNETFEIVLEEIVSPSSGYEIGSRSKGTVTIYDGGGNDVVPVRPAMVLRVAPQTGYENQALRVRTVLELFPPENDGTNAVPYPSKEEFPELYKPIKFHIWTESGTATEDVDYVGIPKHYGITRTCTFTLGGYTTNHGGGYRPSRAKCIFEEVQILEDSHDDGGEIFYLHMNVANDQPEALKLIDGVKGTIWISNDDPMPAAWLARFGRVVAEQALDGIAARVAAPRTPGVEGTLGGQALRAEPDAAGQAAAGGATPGALGHTSGAGLARGLGSGAPGGLGTAPGAGSASDRLGGTRFGTPSRHAGTMTAREALLGTRFSLTGHADASGGTMAFWGRAGETRFDGAERGAGTDTRLDGTVTTAMLGVDYAREPLAERTGSEAASRWAMEAAWGLPIFGGRFTGSPHVGLGLATGTREWTLGWRLVPEAGAGTPEVSFGVRATRREADTAEAEHTVGLQTRMRW